MIRTLFVLCLLTSVCWSSTTAAENHWPRFRGPNADGVAPDHRRLPITWTTTKNVNWVTCHDARSGEEVYGKQRFSPRGSFTASPFAFNGRLFCLSEDGLTYVVKPGPEFEILATNPLDELCISSPAIVGDKLLIRTASKLYCLTEGAELDAGK